MQPQIDAARKAGYSDEEIQQYVGNRFRPQKSTPVQKPKKNGGVKGFLTSLISEAGGTGGALAGAGTGAAIGSVVPGVGTAIGGLVGAGLGGFLGGTGGRVVENKVRDNRIGIGDALKEGAISGIAGAGPIKLLKGAAGAVKGAAKGATAAETATVKRLTSRGIPVRSTSDETTGRGVKQVINKMFVNPTVSELENATGSLAKKGYKVSSKVGSTTARKSVGGRSIPIKSIESTATGTAVPSVVNQTITGKSPDEINALAEGLVKKGYKVDVKGSNLQGRRTIGGRGIPIKSIDSTSLSESSPSTINKTFTDKSSSEINDLQSKLVKKGYKVIVKKGSITGRKSLNNKGGTSIFEQSNKIPVTQVSASKQVISLRPDKEVTTMLPAQPRKFNNTEKVPVTQISAKKHTVPLQSSDETTSIIPGKPRKFESTEGSTTVNMQGKRTAVPLNQAKDTKSEIINTPDRFATETIETAPAVSRAQNALKGANEAVGSSFLGRLTNRTGKRLTEAGSGLKANKNVGGVANLDEQSNFMSRYVGTPRKQRVLMERDMKDLSKQVDDVLTATPVKVDGTQVGVRLKTAMDDLTDERFIDIDLNNPSVAKIIDRYAAKFATKQDAKGINDVVKTLNKTATRAQEKLVNPAAGVLTAQEQAALALKRAGDDVLGQVPEIAPLKKQMAQIFEVTPQVAKAGEKGLPVPFLQGLTVKAPLQAAKGVESRVGSALQGQGANASAAPGVAGFASRIFAGRTLDQDLPAPEEQQAAPEDLSFPKLEDINVEPEQDRDPYAPENVQSSVSKIIEQGGTQKDIAEFLSNAKIMNDISNTGKSTKRKTEAQVAREEAYGISQDALADLDKGSIATGPVMAKLEDLKGIFNAGDQETVDFNRKIGALRSAIIKARGGSAVTDTELKIINEFVPKKGDSDQMIRSKLKYIEETFGKAAGEVEPSNLDEITAGA